MTALTILRHAKSSWDEPQLDDFDRPLNERGRKAARRVGSELKRRRFRFDQVIASPALRVRQTLDELVHGYGQVLDVRFDQQIYAASSKTLFELIRSIPESVHAPLLVGHNPGVQELLLTLAADDAQGLRCEVAVKFPTAAVAFVELPAPRWAEVAAETGRIVELILPRDLD